MRDLLNLRQVGESTLRHLADLFADDRNPVAPTDVSVEAGIVFADIEGFSDTVAREGDDAATLVLDRLDVAVDRVLGAGSARLVKRLGDGVMITADNPAEALRVTAALPLSFADAMSDLPFQLRLRVGAHRGVVRQRGEDLIGYHVNLAARVAEAAPGGTAYITEGLLSAVSLPPGMTVEPVGQLVAKGVPERPNVFRLLAAPAPAGEAVAPADEPASQTPTDLSV